MNEGQGAVTAAWELPRGWASGWRWLFCVLLMAWRGKSVARLWIPAGRLHRGRAGLVRPEIPVVQPVGPRLRGGAPRAVALPALN